MLDLTWRWKFIQDKYTLGILWYFRSEVLLSCLWLLEHLLPIWLMKNCFTQI